MHKCYKCGKNAFWKCRKCDHWCCYKHIDYHYWHEPASTGELKKRHAWLCEHCIKELKERREHAAKVDSSNGK